MTSRSLLVELFVEELPPKALNTLGESFARLILEGLRAQGLTTESAATAFATPRRLAALIPNVAAKAADKRLEQKLMPAHVGFDALGKPTPALFKRLSALGFDAAALANIQRVADGQTESLFLSTTVSGVTLVAGLQKALDEMLTQLPIPKVMSYQLEDGWSTVNFVRPAHGLVALHGQEVVPVSILGLKAGRSTHGHRFEAPRAIEIKDADSYAHQLEAEGAVLASFAGRRAEIVRQLEAAAAQLNLRPIDDHALLDEVTALVERPTVFACQFEKEFLEVPPECLILTMKANQKYFPLLDAHGQLSNRFLVVSNIRPADPSRVIDGNERVVRPRLADAKFFFEQDKKKPLISHLQGLGKVVYHNQLGSQLERIQRLKRLAAQVIPTTHIDEAADLCKCDLLTSMVGEFPELQGIMGRYYALAEGIQAEVADAIREHYLPRGAGDELPVTKTGIALAIADKLDAIAGVFAIEQKPTGTKDPFGVRRAAIGVLRISIERALDIDLVALIARALELQPVAVKPTVATDIYDYIMERLRAYYLEGEAALRISAEMFDAVLANRPSSPLDFDRRLRALAGFLQLPDAQSLTAANKRISNILRKSGQKSFPAIDATRLREPAEHTLYEQVIRMAQITAPLFSARDYTQALTQLASLRPVVDAFFASVMVMAEDAALRANRLALLHELRGLFLRVADLSRLPG